MYVLCAGKLHRREQAWGGGQGEVFRSKRKFCTTIKAYLALCTASEKFCGLRFFLLLFFKPPFVVHPRWQEAQQQDKATDLRGRAGVFRQHGAQHPTQAGEEKLKKKAPTGEKKTKGKETRTRALQMQQPLRRL